MNKLFSFWGMVQADAKIFFGFVVGGMVAMTLLRYLGLPQSIITAVMVSIVVFYTIVVLAYARLFLRLDQAGDNAYYLGLIFTLLSMMFALFTVSDRLYAASDRQIESVIGDFGLALATTLAGIVCRLFLHQMRTDPADIERQTRLELAGAAESMRQQIKGLSLQLNDFVDEISQRNNDFLSEFTSKQIASLENILKENENASKNLNSQAVGLSGDWGQVQPMFLQSLTTLSEKMSELSASLEQAGSASLQSVNRFSQLETPIERGVVAINGFSDIAMELEDRFSKIASHMSEFAEHTASLRSDSQDLNQNLTKSVDTLEQRISTVIPKLESAIDGLVATTQKLSQSAERTTDAVRASEDGALTVLNGLTEALRKARK